MAIEKKLLDAGTFSIKRSSLKGTGVIGLKSDFLNAADAKKAEAWEKERPRLDGNGQWITANPVYETAGAFSFALLDENKKPYLIEISIGKLRKPGLPFPDAPVREGVVEFNISGYGVGYYRQEATLRLSTKEVFKGKDPELLSQDDIREALAGTIMKNAAFLERARAAAEKSGQEHRARRAGQSLRQKDRL